MEKELTHFSHDHPLIPRTDYMEDGVKVHCYGCQQPISGLSYGCTKCKFFLHKLCAELPKEIIYPSHPDHLLTLLPNALYYPKCDVCTEVCNRFFYNCSDCDFNVDIRCASMVSNIQQRVELKCHKHQLIPLEKSTTFFCDACGEEHSGTSYLCITCGFWLSQKCANSFPTTIKLSDHHHHHPLTLIYSIPHKNINCKICNKRVYRRNWLYYCSNSECRFFFVHVNCAASKVEHSMRVDPSPVRHQRDGKAEVEVEKQITMPVDENVDLITLFTEDLKLTGKYKEATEIRHFSHEHTLYFSNKQTDQESSSSESNLPLLNEEKCNACARRISTPFYRCVQCNFFLHECCAELPSELHHPFHPEHPLCLTTNFRPYECQRCGVYCNLFKFSCSDCNFFLDIGCASLPRTIRHEAHKHTLALRPARFCCSTCDYWIVFGFVCETCNYNLCQRCALMPRTVRHRYDEHPFTLTYHPPLKDQTNDNEEYICEICEEDIDPKFWFYHCGDCDQSLHMDCSRPFDRFSNVKDGVTINIKRHQHLLTPVRGAPKDITNPLCRYCGGSFSNPPSMVYECAPCNYWIHFNCMCKLVAKEI